MEFHRRRKIEAHIDMTPMIDTLLQLFMIFLLSASIVATAIRMDLPKAGVQQKAPPKPWVVSIDLEEKLFIDKEQVSLEQLQAKLKAGLKEGEKKDVLLRADQGLAYKHVIKLVEAIKNAGVTHFHLANEEERKR